MHGEVFTYAETAAYSSASAVGLLLEKAQQLSLPSGKHVSL